MKINILQLKRVILPALLVLLMVAGIANLKAQNQIVNGDFESSSIYGAIAPSYTDYQRVLSNFLVESGHYVINNTTSGHGGGQGWPMPSNSHGKFMIVNGFGGSTNATKVVWKQTVPVTTQTTYTLSYRVANLNQVIYGQIYPSKIQVKINGVNQGDPYQLPSNNNWQNQTMTWNSGTSTSAIIEIYDVCTNNSDLGDDFCIDDISFVPDVVYSVTANADNVNVCLNTPQNIYVLENDEILPNNQGVELDVVIDPQYGVYMINNDAHYIQYVYTGGGSGTDQFKYSATTHGVTSEAWVFVTTNTPPVVGNVAQPGPICDGGSLGIDPPSVNPYAEGVWKYCSTPNGTNWQTFDPLNVPISMNGKYIRYYASNSCGEGHSNNNVQITVTNGPTFSGQTPQIQPNPICAGANLNMTPPAYNANGSQILSYGWVASPTENGEYTSFSLNNISASYNGWYIRYMVESSCGFVYSSPARQLTVTNCNYWIPDSFQNNMFIRGVVLINEMEQASSALELGAFCNDECRGSAFPEKDGNHWLYYMAIGGDSGDEITFRLYDHVLQQELDLCCYNEVPFEANSILGMDDPYEVHFSFSGTFSVSIEVSPEGTGSVVGAGQYQYGTIATLTATASEGYTFVNWMVGDEQVSTESTYSFVVTGDIIVIANFDFISYEVMALANPTDGGSISGSGTFYENTSCTLTAMANEGYTFVNWTISDEVVSTDPVFSFIVTEGVTLIANFNPHYEVTALVNPTESGSVSGTGIYILGTSCTLVATPNEGYAFSNWTIDGEVVSTEPSYTFTVTAPVTITANFNFVQEIQLTAGWNWFSTNLDITLDDLKAALVATGNTNITIKSQNNGSAIYNGVRWRGTLSTLDVREMYKIKVVNGCLLTLEGMPVNPAEHPVTIYHGANWIAFPLNESMMLNNAFAGFAVSGDIIMSQAGSAAYLGNQWRGTITNLEPGQGYIYRSNATNARTLVFPAPAK